MKKTYRVEKYAADGHGGPDDQYTIATGITTLGEARAIVREEMGLKRLSVRRRWSGEGADVEAYHDSLTELGCGGVSIVDETAEDNE